MKSHIKKIAAITTTLFIIAASPSKAQLSAGIMGGVSTGAVEIRNLDNRFANNVVEGKNITGYEAGVFLKLKGGPVYVKPAVLYDFAQGDVTANNQTVTFKSNKIGVPVLFGLNVIGPLNIEAGPVYNYVTNVTEQYNSSNVMLARNGLGYRAGLAIELGLLMFTASYEGMTYSASNNRTGFKEPYKMIFGAGLKFGGTGK